jgi:hypothetical protein
MKARAACAPQSQGKAKTKAEKKSSKSACDGRNEGRLGRVMRGARLRGDGRHDGRLEGYFIVWEKPQQA